MDRVYENRPLEKARFFYTPCAALGAGFSKIRRGGRRLEHLCKRSNIVRVLGLFSLWADLCVFKQMLVKRDPAQSTDAPTAVNEKIPPDVEGIVFVYFQADGSIFHRKNRVIELHCISKMRCGLGYFRPDM